jgi:hypothetical protein
VGEVLVAFGINQARDFTMKIKLKAAVAVVLVGSFVSFSGLMPVRADEFQKKFIPLDMQMVRRHDNFGYTDEEIEKLFSQPLEIDFDTTGEAMDRIKPPPPPGVHPRILFSPDDLPAIRDRLQNTKTGKLEMEAIRTNIKKFVTGPKAVFGKEYESLANGDETVDVYGGSVMGSKLNLTYNLMYEAFRCLIDGDQEGGKKVAAAITTLARIDQREVEANIAKVKAKMKPNGEGDQPNDFRVVAEGATQEGTLGLMYDFAYNWMTDAQRQIVRAACAKASFGMTNIGCQGLYGLTTNSSNWITWSARLIFPTLAIEGEPGYDPTTYERCVFAYRGVMTRGIFAGGEGYEGMGKFFTFNEHMMAMARRGENLLTTTHLRDAFHSYFIASLNPWGMGDTFYDSLAGTDDHVSRNADILAYKYLFPNDKAVDYVFRNNIKPDYSTFSEAVNTRHPFLATEALVTALYAADYDESLSNDQERKEVTKNLPLTYFSNDTCNMVTRSSWDPDALYLNYLNRAVRGGHQYSDRSHFSIYADGRYWGIYHRMRQVGEQYEPKNRSLVLVDGEGPTLCPGRCVAFQDNPQASFIVTDLKPSFDYIADGLYPEKDRSKIVMLPFSNNYFRLHPSPIPWMNLPVDAGPDWYTSTKPNLWGLNGGAPAGKNNQPPPSALWHKSDIPMNKAFRTAGMVRGKHPYVLIVDDVQKDDRTRDYCWGMTLADDAVLGPSSHDSDPEHYRLDVMLDENPATPAKKLEDENEIPDPNHSRHMLIRILQGDGVDHDQPARIETVTDDNGSNPPTISLPKLCIHAKTSDPQFKMLLVPQIAGQESPTTSWNAAKTAVKISWPDQTDAVTFTHVDGGRTGFSIVRNGQSIMQMK